MTSRFGDYEKPRTYGPNPMRVAHTTARPCKQRPKQPRPPAAGRQHPVDLTSNDSPPLEAVAPAPVEMTSYGQPAHSSRKHDPLRGLPTGLGQPPRLADRTTAPPGLPTSPQATTTTSGSSNLKHQTTTRQPPTNRRYHPPENARKTHRNQRPAPKTPLRATKPRLARQSGARVTYDHPRSLPFPSG